MEVFRGFKNQGRVTKREAGTMKSEVRKMNRNEVINMYKKEVIIFRRENVNITKIIIVSCYSGRKRLEK